MPWRDSITALKLRALIPGDVFAPHQLGARYATGSDVVPDLSEALRWYRLGARRGDPESQYDLGFMYLVGEGVAPSPEVALKWLQAAAGLGHGRSASLLAELYAAGSNGVQRNEVEAARWSDIAQRSGLGS